MDSSSPTIIRMQVAKSNLVEQKCELVDCGGLLRVTCPSLKTFIDTFDIFKRVAHGSTDWITPGKEQWVSRDRQNR